MRHCVPGLVVVLTIVAVAQAQIKLVGPEWVEVGQSFEVSVENLHLDLSIFADGGTPPQVEWRDVPKGGSIRSRLEVLIVMDEKIKKPKWVVSPYATVMLTEPGKVGIVLMVVQEGVGALLVHEVTVGPFPDPPLPPPPPNRKWQIVIVHESNDKDNLPRSQQVLLSSIVFRKTLAAAGHHLIEGGIVDHDIRGAGGEVPKVLAPFFRSCEGKPLPRICIVPLTGGAVKSYPLPLTGSGVFGLLENPPER